MKVIHFHLVAIEKVNNNLNKLGKGGLAHSRLFSTATRTSFRPFPHIFSLLFRLSISRLNPF